MIKCLSIAFLKTSADTTRCKSTNIGAVDTKNGKWKYYSS